VGLVQLFRSEWKRATKRLRSAAGAPRRVCWATGSLLAPILRELADDLHSVDGLTVDVVPAESSLFGGAVTIAGLISGEDIVTALTDRQCDRLILPRSMFDTAEGQRTIDGWTVDQIGERLNVDVVIGESPRDLLTKTLEQPRRRGLSLTGPAVTPELTAIWR
jgi:NifB/MoaA-like Fe-S oxidoreductase